MQFSSSDSAIYIQISEHVMMLISSQKQFRSHSHVSISMPSHQCFQIDRPCRADDKSISIGGPKMPPKILSTHYLNSASKTWPHRLPQKPTGAGESPINKPALPCRPLRGRILSEMPAPRGSANPIPWACLSATPRCFYCFPPLEPSRCFLPADFFRRFLSRRCFPPRSRLPAGGAAIK
jgi:hypothetical protein